jgi:hypothetical protein
MAKRGSFANGDGDDDDMMLIHETDVIHMWHCPLYEVTFIRNTGDCSHSDISIIIKISVKKFRGQIPTVVTNFETEEIQSITDCDLLGCNVMWSGRRLSIFVGNLLPPSSG